MEGFGAATPFAQLVSDSMADRRFTLLDIGCSSGIDPVWRLFGQRLRAFGFDPNLAEIERLVREERSPGISYVPAFVGVAQNDSGQARMRSGEFLDRNPWSRLSVARTLEVRAKAIADADAIEKTRLNLWNQVQLANPDKPVIVPEFLRDHDVDDVDFIKIDVDGPDFIILRSLAKTLSEAKVLGVGIEVNFFGSDDPDVHTFHNVDRFMRACGFELFTLSMRAYSAAALPAPYLLTIPAQSCWGRPFQGDAIYLRDLAAPEYREWAETSAPAKLAKLAALFSLAGLPDCAAEILVAFREPIGASLDVDKGLEMLIRQCFPSGEEVPTYKEYLQQFAADSRRFYPGQPVAAQTPASDGASDGNGNEVRRLQEELARARMELASLRGSTSWRLTAPLRAAVQSLQHILGGSR